MDLRVLHDILGMPIHHRILQIESFQVGDAGGLYFLREAKVAAQLRYFGDVQFDEKMLLIGVKEMNVRRRTRLHMNGVVSTLAVSTIRQVRHVHTESLSNVLRMAATAPRFSAVRVAVNCSTENRQFLYWVLF